VFIIAQSRASYTLAHSRKTDFQDWLTQGQRILRLSETISFSVDGDAFVDSELHPRSQRYEFRISLTEPVAQGIATEGTRFILLRGSSTHGDEAHTTNGVNGANGVSSEHSTEEPSAEDEDAEELSIDENFLAQSTLSRASIGIAQTQAN
jgi:hypothetical protein